MSILFISILVKFIYISTLVNSFISVHVLNNWQLLTVMFLLCLVFIYNTYHLPIILLLSRP